MRQCGRTASWEISTVLRLYDQRATMARFGVGKESELVRAGRQDLLFVGVVKRDLGPRARRQ